MRFDKHYLPLWVHLIQQSHKYPVQNKRHQFLSQHISQNLSSSNDDDMHTQIDFTHRRT